MSPWRPARSTFTPSVFHHFDAAADFGEVSAQLFCSLPDPGCCTWGGRAVRLRRADYVADFVHSDVLELTRGPNLL